MTTATTEKHARTKALFDRAVAAIAALPSSASASASPNQSISLSNQQLLHFYSLYKQATAGDLPASTLRRPGIFDLRGRAKYDAWLAMHGTPQHVAMRQYVDLFMAFLRKFPDRPIAQELLAEFVSDGAMASQVASSLSVVQASSDSEDENDQQELRNQETLDRTRAPAGHASATTRRRASIATLETDAGGHSFYSATASADDDDDDDDDDPTSDSQDYSSSASDDDGSETASETMVASAPDTSLINPGPVPKPAAATVHHSHRHQGPGSSSSTTSLSTAFYRPDDTRSVTSVATVRAPPPRSPPAVPSDLGRSWVAPERPATGAEDGVGVTPSASAPPSRDFGRASPQRVPPAAATDAQVAALQAQIARLQSQLSVRPSSSSAAKTRQSGLLHVIRLSGGWVGRWLLRSVVAWVMLATVGRELRRRNSHVYFLLEWLVKVAVGIEAL